MEFRGFPFCGWLIAKQLKGARHGSCDCGWRRDLDHDDDGTDNAADDQTLSMYNVDDLMGKTEVIDNSMCSKSISMGEGSTSELGNW